METYPDDKHTTAEVDRELVRLADGVAMRLRAHGVGARTLTLKVRFAGFTTITRSVTSADALDVANDIVAVLRPVLQAIDPSPGVRLLGVSGSNLSAPSRQLSFDEIDGAGTSGDAAAAVDEIRDRFGADAIAPASTLDADGINVVRRGAQQWGPDG